jgi:hypothetical protein
MNKLVADLLAMAKLFGFDSIYLSKIIIGFDITYRKLPCCYHAVLLLAQRYN